MRPFKVHLNATRPSHSMTRFALRDRVAALHIHRVVALLDLHHPFTSAVVKPRRPDPISATRSRIVPCARSRPAVSVRSCPVIPSDGIPETPLFYSALHFEKPCSGRGLINPTVEWLDPRSSTDDSRPPWIETKLVTHRADLAASAGNRYGLSCFRRARDI
jgi:hypothetical protein